jgi:hypothetical protein
VALYNEPADDYESAYDLSVDNLGNVFVTGSSFGGSTYDDYATVKYDANGTLLWVKRYNGPGNGSDGAFDLTIDNSGYIYVTGYSYDLGTNTDFTTVKYDTYGNQLWATRYNGPANIDDTASALAIDDFGNVYVTSVSFDDANGNDYATVKYGPAGNQLWAARYNGTGNSDDYASSIFVDNNGYVYITGQSITSGMNFDYATIKYTQRDYCISPVIGDLDNDCKVDITDFAILASHCLECNYALHQDCQ